MQPGATPGCAVLSVLLAESEGAGDALHVMGVLLLGIYLERSFITGLVICAR